MSADRPVADSVAAESARGCADETGASTRAYEVHSSAESELVIGVVGPLGTDNEKLRMFLTARLKEYGYQVVLIRMSQTLIPLLAGVDEIEEQDAAKRANRLIDLGNTLRRDANNPAVLAIAVAAEIARLRPDPTGKVQRIAYLITSLKRSEEVAELRKIYGSGFYLIAVHTDGETRVKNLMHRGMLQWEAQKLVERDEHEADRFGQDTRDTFHLADFFLADESNDDKLRNSVARTLDLVFGHPHLTPTFNEFAMFMAFAAAVRSADLSRQVGAVIARRNEILSTGANDCPCPGGGLYWPVFIGDRIDDAPRGRDYKRGFDSNAREKTELIESIVQQCPGPEQDSMRTLLRRSGIKEITEYGRVVHAEMEALLACARRGVSCVGATLYCSTFPCHNCGKHIVAAGIEQVIYVEPYPKSRTFKFHDEAVTTERLEDGDLRVRFKPFIGVGPRLFFDLFSLSLSQGRVIRRKDEDGQSVSWTPAGAMPRVQALPFAARRFEQAAIEYIKQRIQVKEGEMKT